MSQHIFARLFAATVLAVTLAACSSQVPVAPGALFSADGGSQDARASTGVPGVYTLSFWAATPTFEEVSSLPVLTAELVLKADVTDTLGNPAVKGTVTFEYCSYGGRPNEITQADEAPKEACEQGLAKWARLRSLSVENGGNCLALGSGSACMPFGIVRIPRTIGFRFRYAQQKGTIASGTSPASNFVWVAKP